MATLAALYGRYVGQHGGQLPPDEAALKTFIRLEGKPLLSRRGATEVDALFLSSRDGKPLTIAYGKSSPKVDFAPGTVVAREETGLHGKRLAVFTSGILVELDTATFDVIVRSTAK